MNDPTANPVPELAEPAAPSDASIADIIKSVRRITRATDIRSKQVAREIGLTIPQIVVLDAVRLFGEMTTAAISRHADLSAATTVVILDKLEQKGLVSRRRSPADRRIVHTRLTARGAAMLAGAPSLFNDRFIGGFAALPVRERRRIAAAFRKVADLMDPQDA